VTSAHIVTLVAVPGEASDTDAPEQLSDDDRVPLIVIRNRFGSKPSVTQTGAHDQVHRFAAKRPGMLCRRPPLFSNRDGRGSDVPIALGQRIVSLMLDLLLLALPMMVAVKQPVTIVFHTPGRFLQGVGG
jgi:hypothetical protein